MRDEHGKREGHEQSTGSLNGQCVLNSRDGEIEDKTAAEERKKLLGKNERNT